MRSSIALLMFLGIPPALPAAQLDPFAGPKPIAVFIETNPWAELIGSDMPRVAVYETGELIYVKISGNHAEYRHLQFQPGEFSRLKKRFKPVLALKDLKHFYDLAPGVTDQPSSAFYLRDGAREMVTMVYGLKDPSTRLPGYTRFPGARRPDAVPDELRELHKWLLGISRSTTWIPKYIEELYQWLFGIDYSRSTTWIPRYVEVVLWDYSYAPDPSIIWPKDWPALGSERAVAHGGSYSIFLDGSALPRLRNFLASRHERGAVEVGGKKMTAYVRYCFPGEPVWQTAFTAASK